MNKSEEHTVAQTGEAASSSAGQNFDLKDLLESSTAQSSKVKKVGTIAPVDDFKILAERILSNRVLKKATDETDDNSFEDICVQIQSLIQVGVY